MQNGLAFLACGSPFSGEQALLILVALISLLLGALFTVCNLVMLCVIYQRGQSVAWHFLGSFACLGGGVFVIFGLLENFNLAVAGIIVLAIIISVHFASLIGILRHTRPSAPPS